MPVALPAVVAAALDRAPRLVVQPLVDLARGRAVAAASASSASSGSSNGSRAE